jgi:HPt (histidine-containing phosphotransfer) domain-containing protein
VTELKKRFRGIEQILVSTLEAYLETFPISWANLKEAIERRDRGKAKNLVHEIKGMVVNFPNFDLSDRIQKLDHKLLEVELTEELAMEIEDLMADLNEGNRALSQLLDELKAALA